MHPHVSAVLEAAWRQSADDLLRKPHKFGPGIQSLPEQFLILITCHDEKQQLAMLERFASEGVECKALVG